MYTTLIYTTNAYKNEQVIQVGKSDGAVAPRSNYLCISFRPRKTLAIPKNYTVYIH